MKAVLILVAVLVVSVAGCSPSFADGASSGKGGTPPSKKQTGAQTKGSVTNQPSQRPADPNPPLQVQLPNTNLTLSQSILDRIKKSKK
jgi:hypothetical protein